MSISILIADDEPELRAGIQSQLQGRGFTTEEAKDGVDAWTAFQEHQHDLVLLDVKMPGMTGLELLPKIKAARPSTIVAMITAHANIKDAVAAVQDGAFDYIEKPLKLDQLNQMIDKALEARSLVVEALFSSPESPPESVNFVGNSDPMQRIFQMIDRLAAVTTSVLIRGENGTGKELVARAIHVNSPRKHKPFVAVNCGAIPENLVEAELFGFEKGAFTGATQRKMGKFQYASGGTLFLDEIGDLPLPMQVKLLRAVQEQRITPVGSNREVRVDVRIIAATNKDLDQMMGAGTFRQDLFYRLNVMPVHLPPLRNRMEDIPSLAQHFVAKFNQRHGRQIQSLSADALNVVRAYDWPGNIRELENAIEHAFVIERNDVIAATSLPEHVREAVQDKAEGWTMPQMGMPIPSSSGAEAVLSYQSAKEQFEKEFIVAALKANNGRINQTCDRAGIPKNTLLRKMRKYGIRVESLE